MKSHNCGIILRGIISSETKSSTAFPACSQHPPQIYRHIHISTYLNKLIIIQIRTAIADQDNSAKS